MSLSWLVNYVIDLMLQILFLFLQFLIEIVKALSFYTKSVDLFTQCPICLQKLTKLAIHLRYTQHNCCFNANNTAKTAKVTRFSNSVKTYR